MSCPLLSWIIICYVVSVKLFIVAINLSICLSVCLSIYPSIYLYNYMYRSPYKHSGTSLKDPFFARQSQKTIRNNHINWKIPFFYSIICSIPQFSPFVTPRKKKFKADGREFNLFFIATWTKEICLHSCHRKTYSWFICCQSLTRKTKQCQQNF